MEVACEIVGIICVLFVFFTEIEDI